VLDRCCGQQHAQYNVSMQSGRRASQTLDAE
jgi:hypothetical protein